MHTPLPYPLSPSSSNPFFFLLPQWAWWSSFDVPSGLSDRMWFSTQDLHWAINTWALPCEKRSVLHASSPSLHTLISCMEVLALLAAPTLLLSYLWPLAQKARQRPTTPDDGPSLESTGRGTLPSALDPPPSPPQITDDVAWEASARQVESGHFPSPRRLYIRLLSTTGQGVRDEEVETQVTWYIQTFSPAPPSQPAQGGDGEEKGEEKGEKSSESGMAWTVLRRLESALRPLQARQSPSRQRPTIPEPQEKAEERGQQQGGGEVVVEIVGKYVPSDAMRAALPPAVARNVTIAGNGQQHR